MVGKLLDRLIEDPFKIIEDSAVMQEVITIIKEAKEEIVLVSPYNDYHINLENPLKAAAKEVSIVAVCREEQKGKEDTHLKWLSGLPADVHLVKRLHAKIYCNESTAMITSMNLLEGSANNSKEIGIRIKDPARVAQIRRYVDEELISHGRQIAARPKTLAKRPPTAEGTKTPDRGFCIRCGEGIPYNPERPLCLKDFRAWNRYKNRNFEEKRCHRCGEESKTSLAEPLCHLHREAASAR